MQDIVIKINWIYFLSIVGLLILLAWQAGVKFATLGEAIRGIRKDISRIFDRLSDYERAAVTKAGSPLVLNDIGEKILSGSGLDKIIAQYSEELIKELEKLKLSTAYDVQDKSFEVLRNFVNSKIEILNQLKTYVYNNPKIETVDIDVDGTIYTGAIILRDLYLIKHPQLKSTTFEPSKTKNQK